MKAAFLLESLQFLLRWLHLIAGISWIGNSFYFMWLDASFAAPEKKQDHLDGELYMVHGGHFYHVEKRKIHPSAMPGLVHWFKWEATLTWITGFILLIALYYLTGGIYLIGTGSYLQSANAGIAVSLILIFGTWLVYDCLWLSKLAEKNIYATYAVSILLVVGLCKLLCFLFNGRGAFLHLGAIFATLMICNVWMRILPGQRKMFADAQEGKVPDYSSGIKAKWRSTHNSYLTLPVLFAMISNHFSSLYTGNNNWIILFLFCVLGAVFRHMMIQWNYERSGKNLLLPIGALLVLILFFSSRETNGNDAPVPDFKTVKSVIAARCFSCHANPTKDPLFATVQGGVDFSDEKNIVLFAARIRERAVITKTMPFGNRTNMTQEERDLLGAWINAGSPHE